MSEIPEKDLSKNTFKFVIHLCLSLYEFQLFNNTKTDAVAKIEVQLKNSNSMLQTLIVNQAEPPCDRCNYFKNNDMNFDGYKDIQLLSWWEVTGNAGYDIWLFGPQTKRFYLQ